MPVFRSRRATKSGGVMSLDAIRRAALPGSRTIRSTFISILLMAAVVLGLVAMHDSGAEHLPHNGASAAESAPHGGHLVDAAPSSIELLPAAAAAGVTAMVAVCDTDCMAGLLDCAAIAMACAMMIAFAVVLALATRPAMTARLRDGGVAVLAVVRDSVASHLRPDLHVLSISRT
jgi:hypothetical protein